MNPLHFFQKCSRRIRKYHYIRNFQICDISSGFGKDGAGKNCCVIGKEHIRVGKDSFFGEGCELIAMDTHFSQQLDSHLDIGNHVRITARGRITCAGHITIKDDVLMAPDVFITDHNHGMDPTLPGGYSPQPLIIKDVVIEEGAWLGQRVCVLPGVTIGAHSIIGANSVVTHDIPPCCIAAGAPARVIKRWNDETKQWIRCCLK